MITLRKSDARGRGQHGWLDSRHTFSFADYRDDRFTGFSDLLVINEDRVAAGAGFPAHAHRDMEILSWVLSGALAHEDSLGHGSTIRPGDLQRMSAGTGIRHSEFNASGEEGVHFLQIWIVPGRHGLAPGYEQKTFPEAERRGKLRVLAAPGGEDGAVTIHQDARLLGALLSPGAEVRHPLRPGRRGWVQVARGAIELNGTRLDAGDGAAIADEQELVLRGAAEGDAEVLVFDLR